MKGALHDIVIVGSGLVGALAAAGLARAHGGRGGTVTLVALPDQVPDANDSLDPFGPALPLRPGHVATLGLLGLDARNVLAAADGSFSLGTAFTGWASPDSAGFQPHGGTGAPLQGIGFQHLVWRARAAGHKLRMTDYALAALAAQADRFALPADDPRSVLSTLDPGTHVHRDGLTALALQTAMTAGARQAAPLRSIERAADGRVDALLLADGIRLAGDWFIDASGPAAALAGPDNGWIDWRRWLPCYRALVTPLAPGGPPPPYALHAADPTGWTRHVPLRGGTWTTRLTATGDGTGFVCGHRRRLWDGNVTFLGAAASLMDPVGAASLSLTLSALTHLLALYPVHPGRGVEAGEYQRRVQNELEQARDFAVARYKTNGRTGEVFWDDARARAVPDSLSHRLERFRSRGQVPAYDGELVDNMDWINLFDSQGIRADRCDALATAIPDVAILAHLERLRAVLLRAVGAMPTHARVLSDVTGGT